MNIHSVWLVAAVAGCLGETEGALEARLAEPVELQVAQPASIQIAVADRDGTPVELNPRLEGGKLGLHAVDGRLRAGDLELRLADLEIPAEHTVLGSPVRLVDVHVVASGDIELPATWDGELGTAKGRAPLSLRWSLAGDRGPVELAPQALDAELSVAVFVDVDGDEVGAEVKLSAPGPLWRLGALSVADLELAFGAAAQP